ncbi:hypothetical protein AnigIFM63309_004282 [Aspergillus niger]|nr:hypothetical protein AnigIFM63309_004282 [Aspergillus niger]
MLSAGFIPLSDRVYLRNGRKKSKTTGTVEPTTIIIFGWGDGMPKHVSKYADGFHDLYPSARILVVLSSTLQALSQPVEERIQDMMPVIDTVFPTATGDGKTYQKRHGADNRFPHKLLICDSTPGGLSLSRQAGRWSRAMAVGTSKFFPWPFIVTQALWFVLLWVHYILERLRGLEPSGVWADRVMNDESVTTRESSRLYLYSKEDEIIGFEDLEENVAQVKTLGYQAVDLELFEGSPHVGHMKLHPQQYWGKISECWKAAIARK